MATKIHSVDTNGLARLPAATALPVAATVNNDCNSRRSAVAGLLPGIIISRLNGMDTTRFDEAMLLKLFQAATGKLVLTNIGKGDVGVQSRTAVK